MAVEDLTAALRRRTAERDELRASLERTELPNVLSATQISEIVEALGGLSAVLGEATGAERAEVYASLGLRLDYDPHLQRVTATADLSRVARRVRGRCCRGCRSSVGRWLSTCGRIGRIDGGSARGTPAQRRRADH